MRRVAQRGIGRHDGRHHNRRIGGQHRRPFLDMMTEPGEQICHVPNRGRDFGVDGVAIGRSVGKGDAQPARVTSDLFHERSLRRRRDIGARGLRSVDRVQHRGAVAHADAQHVATGKAAPAFAAVGSERIARPARFQSEHAGRGSRDADRTAAVAGMRDRKNARGDGSTGAAGRTARGVGGIPGVAGRTEQPGFGGRHQSEFRTGAFSEDRHPGIEEALGEGAGMIGDIVLVDARARGRPRAL